jgi:hypothetical protein
MKFDRQIVAVALTNGARILYSDDDGVKKFGERSGLKIVRTSDLPLPAVQQDLFEASRPSRLNEKRRQPRRAAARSVPVGAT